MIDIWQNRAGAGVHLSHSITGWRPETALAGPRRRQQLAIPHALALGPFGVPDAAPLIGELEPGKFRSIYRLQGRSPELTIGRGIWLTIGRLRLLRGGRLGLLRALLARAAGNRHGRCDKRGEERSGLLGRGNQARDG
jgi:hypothetical protein